MYNFSVLYWFSQLPEPVCQSNQSLSQHEGELFCHQSSNGRVVIWARCALRQYIKYMLLTFHCTHGWLWVSLHKVKFILRAFFHVTSSDNIISWDYSVPWQGLTFSIGNVNYCWKGTTFCLASDGLFPVLKSPIMMINSDLELDLILILDLTHLNHDNENIPLSLVIFGAVPPSPPAV